jgi:hypothetical protein
MLASARAARHGSQRDRRAKKSPCRDRADEALLCGFAPARGWPASRPLPTAVLVRSLRASTSRVTIAGRSCSIVPSFAGHRGVLPLVPVHVQVFDQYLAAVILTGSRADRRPQRGWQVADRRGRVLRGPSRARPMVNSQVVWAGSALRLRSPGADLSHGLLVRRGVASAQALRCAVCTKPLARRTDATRGMLPTPDRTTARLEERCTSVRELCSQFRPIADKSKPARLFRSPQIENPSSRDE